MPGGDAMSEIIAGLRKKRSDGKGFVVSTPTDGLRLNPYYEIVSELGVDCEDPFDCYDYWPRIERLNRRRPELAPFLAHVAPSEKVSRYGLRERCVELFAHAIPTPAAVGALGKMGTIVEIGAGTGYWASLAAGAGATVHAFDDFSWKLRPLWFDVKKGGASRAASVDAETLLLCWPPHDAQMATRALRAFRGERAVYIGESEHGNCATPSFFRELDLRWNRVDQLPSITWPGLHDRVTVWTRRSEVEP